MDDDDPLLDIYPYTFKVFVGSRLPLSGVYNELFKKYPDLDWYGFIADDVVPRTKYWDVTLIEAAGSDGMAVPSGGHKDYALAPHFVLGGDLVRSVGWLALPGLDRLYIDTVWNEIAARRGVLKHVPEVVLEHCHFSNGKALMDSTYKKHNKKQDKEIYEAFKLDNYLSQE